MGKSLKAKKEKKADFSKVKLKVGKKLPKGQNLTETRFKSKKIVISDQLSKQQGEGPVTKKKLSLKELLSHLRHYSVYVRQDGLSGLRELLTCHPELVVPSLSQILSSVAALLVDDDYKLRTDCVTLISDIVNQVSEEQLLPFFEALVAHLTCAMTHIRPSVQQTSLPLLAGLLARCRRLLSASVDLLLPTLLEQISRCGAAGGGRALLADPGSRLSAAGWRVTVLRQLAQLLAARPDGGGRRPAAGPARTVPAAAHCPLYPGPAEPDQQQGALVTAPAGQQRRLLQEPDQLRRFSATVVPLLFQAYSEVAPDRDKDGSLLSDESAETLVVVLQVLVELLRQMQHLDTTKNTSLVGWLAVTHWAELERHVFVSFSYSRLVGRRRKGAEPTELGSDAVNVLVCELAACLGGGGELAGPVRAAVLDYVAAYLESERWAELSRVCRLLPELLAAGDLTSDMGRRLGCVRAAAERHGRVQTGQQGVELTRLLATLVTEPRFAAVARSEDVEKWTTLLLPSVRPGEDGLELLVLLRKMAIMGRGNFLEALNSEAANLLKLAANAPPVDEVTLWQRGLVELLFWSGNPTPEAMDQFQRFLDSELVDGSVKHYAREVLQEKYAPVCVDVAG